jgi:tetratricopeptide (TPR) repeat protein
MKALRNNPRRGLVALALLLSVGLVVPARAVDDDLRKRALALNLITGADPLKGQVLLLLDDPAGTRKLLAVAVKMAKEKPQPFGPNATRILAETASKLKEVEAAETFYRLYSEQALKRLSGEGVSTAYIGLIDVLYRSKKYAETEELCKEFLGTEELCKEFLGIEGSDSIDEWKENAFEIMIVAMARGGKIDKAVEILDSLLKKQPNSWATMEMKADVLREAGKLEESLKLYEEVGDRIKKDDRIDKDKREKYLDRVRYALSGVYVELDQVDKAAEQLKVLLSHEPDNATYNNDLGYIWADHDMNLAESEKLIRKALEEDRRRRHKKNPDLKPEQDKDNAAYLDSLGWVLAKQARYKEAKPLLLEAVQQEEGKHIEIYDHLADVHLALGEKAEAVAAWKKGIEVAGANKREQQRKAAIEKKLKANQ